MLYAKLFNKINSIMFFHYLQTNYNMNVNMFNKINSIMIFHYYCYLTRPVTLTLRLMMIVDGSKSAISLPRINLALQLNAQSFKMEAAMHSQPFIQMHYALFMCTCSA